MIKILILFLFISLNISLQAQVEEKPFTYVENMPEFVGGKEVMYKYIYSNLHYPRQAKKNKISGQVMVRFEVGKTGELREIRVTRKLGYGCDEEAIRIIESMNDGYKWTPGNHNGRTVPVDIQLSIKFPSDKK